jgi:hypothetical protein
VPQSSSKKTNLSIFKNKEAKSNKEQHFQDHLPGEKIVIEVHQIAIRPEQ